MTEESASAGGGAGRAAGVIADGYPLLTAFSPPLNLVAYVAAREGCPIGLVLSELACGRAILPTSRKHPELEPCIIGRAFRTKINANIGTSAVSSGMDEEVAKVRRARRVPLPA